MAAGKVHTHLTRGKFPTGRETNENGRKESPFRPNTTYQVFNSHSRSLLYSM